MLDNDAQEDPFFTSLRAKMCSSQLDSGLTYEDIASLLKIEPAELVRDYFSGRKDVPIYLLYRYAKLVRRPLYWFFGEDPSTISIERAQTALGNIARLRIYIDAIEGEFHQVLTGGSGLEQLPKEKSFANPGKGSGGQVVDFAPYLSRARAILEREAEYSEDSEEVFEESVELIAQSLYSIEMAQNPLRQP